MSTIADIEAAVENLPAPQVDELAGWLETLRVRRATPPPVESWLERARGAARPERDDSERNGPHPRRGMSGFLFDTNVLLNF